MGEANTKRIVRIAALAIGLSLLAACGTSGGSSEGAETTEPDVASTTAPATTTTEATTTTSGIDFGQQYLDLSNPPNCARAAFTDAAEAMSGGTGNVSEAQWADIQAKLIPAAAKVADAEATFAKELRAATWPDDLQDDIDALAGVVDEDAADWRAVADATTFQQFLDAIQAIPDRSSNSQAVRKALGLAPDASDSSHACGPTA